MGKKDIYFIVNPVSGTTNKSNIPEQAKTILDSSRFNFQIKRTEYAGHGYELARQAAADGIDYVIAVGGDGTVNEVGRGLINSDTAMGIIPLGSGNGLARDLGISTNVKKAMSVLNQEKVIVMDYAKANDRIFFCTCGIGFDAIVADKVAGSKNRGFLMYLQKMISTFFTRKPDTYKIIYPEGTIEQQMFLVTCANTGQYGYNAYIAPHADVQDGLLDITILKPINILNVPKIGIQMFKKTLYKNKKMIGIKTNDVTISRDKEGPMHLDGDSYIMGKEIHVQIIPKGLKMLVP